MFTPFGRDYWEGRWLRDEGVLALKEGIGLGSGMSGQGRGVCRERRRLIRVG